ncbi:TMhelix containing protein [Vibrio phage 1.106.O._10N.286.51.F7]|nr:TMhelix containing protein [Vibrio phage 1.106.O._10N.286.51.F7]
MRCILILAFDLILSVASGYVFSELWGFFVVPLGAPAIGVIHAIGLAALIHMTSPLSSERDPDIAHMLVSKIFRILFCYALGVIAHSLM